MSNKSLGSHRSITSFVNAKLSGFTLSDKSFKALFELMFSEKDNIMFEKSEGYRIACTTYGECRQSLLRRAAALRQRLEGVPQGAVIGLYLQNSVEWIELFWAILASGFRPLLLNTRLGVPVLEQALASVKAAAVIAESGGAGFSLRTIPLCELSPADEPIAPQSFGESIFVMSSGTSEHVKVCEYTADEFGCMIGDSAVIISKCPAMKRHYKGRLKLLAFLPFCHIFGLVAVYIWFAFFSRTFVLLKDMAPATIIDTIRRHEVTHIFAVPMFWNKVRSEALKEIASRGSSVENKFNKAYELAKKLAPVPFIGSAFSRLAFRKVRAGLFGESISFMISGGSEISCEVLEFFNAIGYRLANGYGMTEIGITSVELSSSFKKLSGGSVGLPFSSVEYHIDESGQLLVGGSSVALRIYEGDSVRERSGLFATGDLAENKDGRWYILGRMDDVVVSASGENLNPCLIEDKLSACGANECCLTSVKENGNTVPAVVASVNPLMNSQGVRRVYEGIKAALAENGLEGQISKVLIVKQPLIEANDFKLNRSKVKKCLENGGFAFADMQSPAGGEAQDSELLLNIRRLFAQALNKSVEEIGPDTDFFLDEGGSSLDFFAVASELQNEYGVAFPVDSSLSLSRPSEIAAFITDRVNGK